MKACCYTKLIINQKGKGELFCGFIIIWISSLALISNKNHGDILQNKKIMNFFMAVWCGVLILIQVIAWLIDSWLDIN